MKTNSYEDAFYAIAEELGITGAQSLSPQAVFETQIIPEIRRLKALSMSDKQFQELMDEDEGESKW